MESSWLLLLLLVVVLMLVRDQPVRRHLFLVVLEVVRTGMWRSLLLLVGH